MAGDQEPEDPFEWEVRDESMPFREHAIAGSLAGVMEHVSMYPVDTVKTQMQASPGKLGIREAVVDVLHSRGVWGLMRGSTVIGAGCIPAHIGFFGAYEWASARLLVPGGDTQQAAQAAACGAVATLLHDCVLTPHDVVKQRLQMGWHKGPLDCILTLWRQGGLCGLYRSLPITLAMNVPYNAVLVAVNDTLKRAWHVERCGAHSKYSVAHWYFMCAGISGAVAAAATLPLDVVKTQVQTQAQGPPATGLGRQTAGVLLTASAIMKNDGLRGFFRGLTPRMVISAPSAAVCWGTYETARMALHHYVRGEGGQCEQRWLPEGLLGGMSEQRSPALLGPA